MCKCNRHIIHLRVRLCACLETMIISPYVIFRYVKCESIHIAIYCLYIKWNWLVQVLYLMGVWLGWCGDWLTMNTWLAMGAQWLTHCEYMDGWEHSDWLTRNTWMAMGEQWLTHYEYMVGWGTVTDSLGIHGWLEALWIHRWLGAQWLTHCEYMDGWEHSDWLNMHGWLGDSNWLTRNTWMAGIQWLTHYE